MRRLIDWLKSVHPVYAALVVVVLVTWQIAVSLFVGLIRSNETVLDGTAFTLLSAIVASWTGLGIWAGRREQRWYMGIAITALAGIAFITGCSLLWEAFAGDDVAIPSNVAQLLILVISALISIVGASIGYSSYGGDPPPPDETTEGE